MQHLAEKGGDIMHDIPNKIGEVRNCIDHAIDALFNADTDLTNEYDFRTYEALEKALTFQMTKEVNEKTSK